MRSIEIIQPQQESIEEQGSSLERTSRSSIKSAGKARRGLIAAGGLIASLGIASCGSEGGNDQVEPNFTSTPDQSATVVLEDTPTAIPTETVSATSTPTETPEPTATPEPEIDPLEIMSDEVRNIYDGIIELNENEKLSGDPSIPKLDEDRLKEVYLNHLEEAAIMEADESSNQVVLYGKYINIMSILVGEYYRAEDAEIKNVGVRLYAYVEENFPELFFLSDPTEHYGPFAPNR